MRFAALLLPLVLLLASPAAADDRPAGAVRAVIEGQIAAFRADDGVAAYAFAAPRIREIFPDPDLFMAMVRSGYQPVYRPRSIAFGRLEPLDAGWAQEVYVIGPDGESYTALYTLQQQQDGSFKISGCQLIRTPASAA